MASSSDIGRRVKVYWEQDATWYSGRVVSYTSRRGCRIEYDTVEGEDDLVAWHDLAEERHEWLDGGGAAVAASSSAAAKKRARAEPSKAAQKRVAPSKAPSEAIVVKDEHGEDEDEDLVEEVAPPESFTPSRKDVVPPVEKGRVASRARVFSTPQSEAPAAMRRRNSLMNSVSVNRIKSAFSRHTLAPHQWSSEHVLDWLVTLPIDTVSVERSFRSHGIDGTRLLTLADRDLRALGAASLPPGGLAALPAGARVGRCLLQVEMEEMRRRLNAAEREAEEMSARLSSEELSYEAKLTEVYNAHRERVEKLSWDIGSRDEELQQVANDAGQPELVYKLMELSTASAVWNTRKGVAIALRESGGTEAAAALGREESRAAALTLSLALSLTLILSLTLTLTLTRRAGRRRRRGGRRARQGGHWRRRWGP